MLKRYDFVQVGSHLRKAEVQKMEDIEDFESYKDLCKEQFENAQIKVLRLEQPPVEYLEKESRHILPEWPGRYL